VDGFRGRKEWVGKSAEPKPKALLYLLFLWCVALLSQLQSVCVVWVCLIASEMKKE